MICNEAHDLLHGYADGELDLVRSVEVEEHLQSCPVCSRQLTSLRSLRESIQNPALYYPAPPEFKRRIAASLGSPLAPSRQTFPWRALAIAASILLVVTLGWTIARTASRDSDRVAAQITAAHVRSMMMENHLSDVASTDQHTVKPWFNGKLDFSPPVIDLKDHDFPLIGGRLDYIDDRTAAALIYQRRQHKINLFVWPDQGGAESAPVQAQRQGYNLLHWTSGGMSFWAISDLNAGELKQFVDLLRGKKPTSSP